MRMNSSKKSILQGVGLSLILLSYMYSWVIGPRVGLSSFIGIGFFSIIGYIAIYISARNAPLSFWRSISDLWFIYAMLLYLFILSIYGGQGRDIVWTLFGMSALMVFGLISIFDEACFIQGFSYASFLIIFLFLLNVSAAIGDAATFGDSSRTSLSEENEAYTLISYAAAMTLTGALSAISSNVKYKIFSLAIVMASLLSIIMAGTRSVYAGAMMVFSYFIIVRLRRRNNRNNIISYTLLLFVCMISTYFSGFMAERLAALQEATLNAYYTFIGIDAGFIDPAAAGRVYQREYAMSLFYENPIFGAGYKAFWVDFPLLQAFSDLGIFIGLFYNFVVFVAPVFIVIKGLSVKNSAYHLVVALYVVNIPRLFLHGQPYDWVLFSYAFLPYVAVGMLRKSAWRTNAIANKRIGYKQVGT